MELSQVLRRRRMVRAYDPDRPVPAEQVDAVCAAALRAPSAGFTQGVSLVVLDSAEDRTRFWQLTGDRRSIWARGMRNAPVLILVWTSEQAYLDRYAEPDKGWTDRDPGRWSAPYWYVDGGMAAMAALLAAVDAWPRRVLLRHPGRADRRGPIRVRGPGGPAQRRRDQPGVCGAGAGHRLAHPATAQARRTADPPRILACELSHISGKRLGCVAGAVMIP